METYVKGQSLDAIALGSGPSFYRFIKSEVIRYDKDGTVFEPLLYGCGVTPHFLNGLHSYYYGDSVHLKNIPDPNGEYHPGCVTYAGTRNLKDMEEADRNLYKFVHLQPFAQFNLPHGDSSGGMAMSMACYQNDVVGIVGFDATDWKPFLTADRHKEFVRDFFALIRYWQERGKKIVSLMKESPFNEILDKLETFQV